MTPTAAPPEGGEQPAPVAEGGAAGMCHCFASHLMLLFHLLLAWRGSVLEIVLVPPCD